MKRTLTYRGHTMTLTEMRARKRPVYCLSGPIVNEYVCPGNNAAAARVNAGARTIVRTGRDRYTVVDGRARIAVEVYGLNAIACECAESADGNVCWHAAAVHLYLVTAQAVAA